MQAEDFTPPMVDFAFCGRAALSSNPFPSDAEFRAFWQLHRSVLLQWYRDGVPEDFKSAFGFAPGDPERAPHGDDCRPLAWWRFDAPERRRIIAIVEYIPGGDGLLDRRERPATAQEVEELWAMCGFDSKREPKFGGLYVMEDERAYLARLGLLTSQPLHAA